MTNNLAFESNIRSANASPENPANCLFEMKRSENKIKIEVEKVKKVKNKRKNYKLN